MIASLTMPVGPVEAAIPPRKCSMGVIPASESAAANQKVSEKATEVQMAILNRLTEVLQDRPFSGLTVRELANAYAIVRSGVPGGFEAVKK